MLTSDAFHARYMGSNPILSSIMEMSSSGQDTAANKQRLNSGG